MTVRKDGISTKKRLLRAACEVFAEKGYRKGTVGEICRKAASNVAAVNYHFGSKEELYADVWRSAFDEALRAYPPDGGLTDRPGPEQRLHALVRSHLHRSLDDGRLGHAGQILLRELAEPTEAIGKVHHDAIGPLKDLTRSIIAELLGPAAGEPELTFCELSVIHQCLALGFRKGRGKLNESLGESSLIHDSIDELADHITRFSLAGIKAVRQACEYADRPTSIEGEHYVTADESRARK